MDFYIAQLEELLTQYGKVVEVWFDGANAEGPNGKRQVYDWTRIEATVRRLQPEAVMFSDAGPDVRWIGNERGVAGETCWSTIDPASVPYAGYARLGLANSSSAATPTAQCGDRERPDVSIRPGWFWHPAEDGTVRSAENLLDLYFTSVGRNKKRVPPPFLRAGGTRTAQVSSPWRLSGNCGRRRRRSRSSGDGECEASILWVVRPAVRR